MRAPLLYNSYVAHCEDVDRFYPSSLLRRSVSDSFRQQQTPVPEPELPLSSSLPTSSVPIQMTDLNFRRKLFTRKRSGFDDTWSKPFVPSDFNNEAEEVFQFSSENSSRSESECVADNNNKSNEQPEDEEQDEELDSELVFQDFEEDTVSQYDDAIGSRKPSEVRGVPEFNKQFW